MNIFQKFDPLNFIQTEDLNCYRVDWFGIMVNAVSNDMKNKELESIWSDGELLIVETLAEAECISNLLRRLYSAQGEKKEFSIGYFRPGEECDELVDKWFIMQSF
jgi:hypothetical protein